MIRKMATVCAVAFVTAALANGASTFNQSCRVCHGPNGRGSKMVKSIAGTPAPEVRKAIIEGRGTMAPVKVDHVDEVADYVASLKK